MKEYTGTISEFTSLTLHTINKYTNNREIDLDEEIEKFLPTEREFCEKVENVYKWKLIDENNKVIAFQKHDEGVVIEDCEKALKLMLFHYLQKI